MQTQPIFTALRGSREGYLGSGTPQAPRHAPFQLPSQAWPCSSPHCLALAETLGRSVEISHSRAKPARFMEQELPSYLTPPAKYDKCGLAVLAPDELEKDGPIKTDFKSINQRAMIT